MSQRSLKMRITKSLPETLPFLSKAGQLLMPKGLLPILVKTPADIYMVEQALQNKRHIAIIQPVQVSKTHKELYTIGCVGRITTLSENEDGSLYIVVKGIQRFKATGQEKALLKVSYTDFSQDKESLSPLEEGGDRSRLMAVLKDYFSNIQLDINWNDIKNASDESLATSLSMLCPFDAREKQALLESKSLAERMNMLTALIEVSEIKRASDTYTTH